MEFFSAFCKAYACLFGHNETYCYWHCCWRTQLLSHHVVSDMQGLTFLSTKVQDEKHMIVFTRLLG